MTLTNYIATLKGYLDVLIGLQGQFTPSPQLKASQSTRTTQAQAKARQEIQLQIRQIKTTLHYLNSLHLPEEEANFDNDLAYYLHIEETIRATLAKMHSKLRRVSFGEDAIQVFDSPQQESLQPLGRSELELGEVCTSPNSAPCETSAFRPRCGAPTALKVGISNRLRNLDEPPTLPAAVKLEVEQDENTMANEAGTVIVVAHQESLGRPATKIHQVHPETHRTPPANPWLSAQQLCHYFCALPLHLSDMICCLRNELPEASP